MPIREGRITGPLRKGMNRINAGSTAFNTKSILFGGTDEYITFGTGNYDFERTDAFSVSFWIKTTSTNDQLIGNLDSNSPYYGWEIFLRSNGTLLFTLRNTSTTNEISVRSNAGVLVINDDAWYHIVVTYDGSSNGSGVTFYADGSEWGSPTIAVDTLSATTVSPEALTIGIQDDASDAFTGNLDEVAIYDKELSSSEVSDIYNSGAPLDLTTLSSNTNLQSWWRMGDGDTYPTITDNKGSVNGTMTNMESGDIVSDVPGG